MLTRFNNARNFNVDTQLASTLAAVAGALNASVFHAVGFFSANMTGNVSLFSDKLAQGQGSAAIFFIEIVTVFILGAMISALLINMGRRRGIYRIYAFNILVEAAMLAMLGLFEYIVPSLSHGAILILGLSFLMGIQNAVVTCISNARVRTTHVSGTSTDIGIELAMMVDVVCGHEAGSVAAEYMQRLKLHLATLIAFLAGGVVGVWLYLIIGDMLLFLGALVLFMIAAPTWFRPLHIEEQKNV